MNFVYADSLDFVDPGYDFLQDRNAPGRQAYWDDLYPHEILDRPQQPRSRLGGRRLGE